MVQSIEPKTKQDAANETPATRNIFIVIAIAMLIVMLTAAFQCACGEGAAAHKAASAILEEAFHPSEEKRAQTVESIDRAFQVSTNASFSQLGINANEFASWLYEGAAYQIVGIDVKGSGGEQTAHVKVKVTTHSLAAMEDNIARLSDELDKGVFRNASKAEDMYAIIGDVVKQAMVQTPLSSKELTLVLVKKDGAWQASKAEAANFIIDAFTAQ